VDVNIVVPAWRPLPCPCLQELRRLLAQPRLGFLFNGMLLLLWLLLMARAVHLLRVSVSSPKTSILSGI